MMEKQGTTEKESREWMGKCIADSGFKPPKKLLDMQTIEQEE